METTELTRDKLTNRIKLHHEQIFYKTGHLPRNSDVQETFSRELASLDLEYYELLPSITLWLKKNGLLEQDHNGLLDPKQFLVAQMFLDTMDRRSIRQKLKAADVTVTEFNNWRRSPSFMNFLRTEAQRRFADADISADLELVKNVEDGNLDAIKYYHQVTGRYVSPEAVNVAKVLAVMMEILVQYVTPDILTKVAKEMEKKIYTSLASQGYAEAPQIEATSTVDSMEINFG